MPELNRKDRRTLAALTRQIEKAAENGTLASFPQTKLDQAASLEKLRGILNKLDHKE